MKIIECRLVDKRFDRPEIRQWLNYMERELNVLILKKVDEAIRISKELQEKTAEAAIQQTLAEVEKDLPKKGGNGDADKGDGNMNKCERRDL